MCLAYVIYEKSNLFLSLFFSPFARKFKCIWRIFVNHKNQFWFKYTLVYSIQLYFSFVSFILVAKVTIDDKKTIHRESK